MFGGPYVVHSFSTLLILVLRSHLCPADITRSITAGFCWKYASAGGLCTIVSPLTALPRVLCSIYPVSLLGLPAVYHRPSPLLSSPGTADNEDAVVAAFPLLAGHMLCFPFGAGSCCWRGTANVSITPTYCTLTPSLISYTNALADIVLVKEISHAMQPRNKPVGSADTSDSAGPMATLRSGPPSTQGTRLAAPSLQRPPNSNGLSLPTQPLVRGTGDANDTLARHTACQPTLRGQVPEPGAGTRPDELQKQQQTMEVQERERERPEARVTRWHAAPVGMGNAAAQRLWIWLRRHGGA
ncbi:hypothetical protein ERJ75_000387300 [Trypanosoma vivax]|nr:hypothetical protein ERJ75_000387300 [Trypanosoma vivax]